MLALLLYERERGDHMLWGIIIVVVLIIMSMGNT